MSELEDIEVAGSDRGAIDENVLLYGPPGTGKTTQAAKRVVELIDREDYSLTDVCWVTYRRDLAEETLHDLVDYGLLDEHDLIVPHRGKTRWIGTMHAIGYRLSDLPDPVDHDLRRTFADHYGLPYEPGSVRKTVGELLFDTFHWLRGQRLDPTDPSHVRLAPAFAELENRGWQGDIPTVYEEWRDYLDERDRCEFADQLETTLDEGRRPTDGILVLDELHDFNPLMLDTAFAWAQSADVVIAAGDPDQVINRFDGARREHFDTASDTLDLTEVLLGTSYRVFSTAGVAAEQLLANAHTPPPVDRPTSGAVREYRSPTIAESGGRWAVPRPDADGSPVWLLDEQAAGETMFVARTRRQVQGICRALDEGGVIYRSQTGFGGWRRTPRLHLHNGLQKLAAVDPEQLGGAGKQQRLPQAGEGRAPGSVEFDTDEVIAVLDHTPAEYLAHSRSELASAFEHAKTSAELWTGETLDRWVKPAFWNRMTAGAAAARRLNKTGSYGHTTLEERDRNRLCRALQRYDSPVAGDDPGVSVQTIHAAKGKEAPDVVVYDGVTQKIRRRMRGDEAIANNEWRTWYVALTRAGERLHVVRDAFEWTHPIIPDDLLDVASDATESPPVATDGGDGS